MSAYKKTIVKIVFSVPFIAAILYFSWPLLEKVYAKYNHQYNVENVYPAYSQTQEAMMTCVKAFNSQFFLAPAWKKHVSEGQNITVDVYKHAIAPVDSVEYVFVIPDVLKKKVQFWLDSDVPYFKVWNKVVGNPDLSTVHFQKGQYLRAGYFAHYNSVKCNPTNSGRGVMYDWEMYYIIIDGPFTPEISRQYDRAKYNEKVVDFKIKYLGIKGKVFKKSQLTPESPGMEKVYSIKL